MNRASRYLANVTFLSFVRVVVIGFCVCICLRATPIDGKVFERCELAQLLRYGHGLDVSDVANWVCIAQHSSSLNTSAFGGNAQSGSHGLFQISDQYWCSPPGKGVACGITCDRLRDDDLSDDLDCIRIIYQEHQRLSGDGYNAWIAYQPYCRANSFEYVEDCFGPEEREYLHAKSIAANSVEDEDEEEDYVVYSQKRGKVYGRCELAKELFLKHKMPMEEIPTWVCIAQHESNYDTSAVGRLNADGSADHGLFQISDLYWCNHKGGQRKACGLPCSKLLDADITDDVKCVKQIFKEHTRISGNGFTAWTVYNAYCHSTTANYIRGCFDGIDVDKLSTSEEYRQVAVPKKSKKPHGKVYEPCELADELRNKHHLPEDQIATWVCIAKHESDYNTSAIGYGDHGLFQISDIFWCSPPGKGWACGLSCADLEDSDITDDVACIRKIHNEHTHLSGDGFNAWTVYPRFCSGGRSAKYISHCPGYHPQPSASYTYSQQISPNSIEEYPVKQGKIYGRCELANELLTKHGMSMDEIPTWVCIAHHESNFDTSAVGRLNTDGSADHGLFQISDLFWCSHKGGHRKACGLPCSKLLDNDITDDVRCVKQIHDEHTRISGDGFTAWTVYNAYCRERTEQYVRGCFDGSTAAVDFSSPQRAVSYGPAPKNKPKGKVYDECELANELRDKYRMPGDQISTWVCIAKHQSGLNTSSSVSNVHGMFHISDEYWCSPPGKGKVCELHCSDLEDSDISDDIECVRKIYLEHERLSGNGFSAWVVFPQHCSNGRADEYIGHCPGFESLSRNSVRYQQGVFDVSPQYTSRALDISNKPVYDHQFKGNLFLKHFETRPYSASAQESFSASHEVNSILPTSRVYSLNPFLRSFGGKTQAEVFVQATTPTPAFFGNSVFGQPNVFAHPPTTSSPAFFGFPIAPTPTSPHRVQTYEPQNEERAKIDAFKSFATPTLPLPTQTPRANRLHTYQLNTFQPFNPFPTPQFIAPTTQTSTTTRLQAYQANAFNAIRNVATPAPEPFSTFSPSFNPIIPSSLPTVQLQSTTRPYVFVTTTTRAPVSSVFKNSGHYDPGRYDAGRYDSGRYNSGQYDAGKYQQSSTSQLPSTTSVFEKSRIASVAPAIQPALSTSVRTTPSSLVPASAAKPLNSGFYSVYTSAARNEALIPITTTKSPSASRVASSFGHAKPLKPFSTSKTVPAASHTFASYNPPSVTSVFRQSSASRSLATPSLPTITTLNPAIRTVTTRPTTKFDPFRPFGENTRSYDPYAVFNTAKQQTSPFSFLSGKTAASNEVYSTPGVTSKRETSSQPTSTDLQTTRSSTKRETSSKASPSNSVDSKTAQQKTTSVAASASAKPQPSVGTSVVASTKVPDSSEALQQRVEVTSKRIEPTPTSSKSALPTRSAETLPKSAISSGLIKPTSTEESSKSLPNKPQQLKTDQRSASTTRSQPSTKGQTVKHASLVAPKPASSSPYTSSSTTKKPIPVATTKPTRSVAKPALTDTAKTVFSTPAAIGKSSSLSPTRTVSPPSKVAAASRSPTVGTSSWTRSTGTVTPATSVTSLKSASPVSPLSTTKSKTAASRSPLISKSSATRSTTTTKPLSPTRTAVTSPKVAATTTLRPTRVFATTKPPSRSGPSLPKIPPTTTSTKPSPIQPKPAAWGTHRMSRSTRSISTGAVKSTITTKPISSASPEFTDPPTTTSLFTTDVDDTRTAINSVPSIARTKTTFDRSPKVTTTRLNSIQISPTKSHRYTGSLFSTKLNIYDFYYKLYGVYPSSRTSSGLRSTKTARSNVIPTRTS